MHMSLEWDPQKAESNLEKHGISFEEAASALLDPNALTMEDETAEGEPRWVLIGMSNQARLLTVVYTVRIGDEEADDTIRIISARKSTKTEVIFYAQKL
jgi:uncharacterized protein